MIEQEEVLKLLGSGWRVMSIPDAPKLSFMREVGDTRIVVSFSENTVFAGIRKDLGDVPMPGGKKIHLSEHSLSVLVKTESPHAKDALVALYELEARAKSAASIMNIVAVPR